MERDPQNGNELYQKENPTCKIIFQEEERYCVAVFDLVNGSIRTLQGNSALQNGILFVEWQWTVTCCEFELKLQPELYGITCIANHIKTPVTGNRSPVNYCGCEYRNQRFHKIF